MLMTRAIKTSISSGALLYTLHRTRTTAVRTAKKQSEQKQKQENQRIHFASKLNATIS